MGDVLGRIHAATADRPDIAARFPTDALFHAIRLDPYLVTAAKAHPDLSRQLLALVATTGSTRRVLVHGDFSPEEHPGRRAKGRSSSTPNARGTAIRRSIWRSC